MQEPLMENSPTKRKLHHEEIKAKTLGCLQIKGWKKISQTSAQDNSTHILQSIVYLYFLDTQPNF